MQVSNDKDAHYFRLTELAQKWGLSVFHQIFFATDPDCAQIVEDLTEKNLEAYNLMKEAVGNYKRKHGETL
jgi:hypothetical protein